MRGVYRLDLPNAAVDTEGFVTLFLFGATNMLPVALRIDCRSLPVDVKKLNSSAGAALRLANSADAMVTGTVGAGSTTISVITSAMSLPGTDANQFKDRLIQFLANTTTAGLRGQFSVVSSSSIASTPTLTVQNALTTAPVSGDTFILL